MIYGKTRAFNAVHDAVVARDGQVCQYCGTTTARKYIMEHVIPERRGGLTTVYNCVVACDGCNHKKGNKVWVPTNLDALAAVDPSWAARIQTWARVDAEGLVFRIYDLPRAHARRFTDWAAVQGLTEREATRLAQLLLMEQFTVLGPWVEQNGGGT